jgi:hypothetical protein
LDLILDKEWDILVLLDACRYDYFERCNPYKGKLTPFDQGCVGTKQYYQMNFKNRDCSDVVVINHILLFQDWLGDTKFHDVVNVYDTHWDQGFGTVLPEPNTEAALEQIEKYPDKRFLIHYAQPHMPYLDRGTKIVKQKTKKQVVYKNKFQGKVALALNKMKNLFPPMPFWCVEKVFGNSAGVGEIYFKEGFEGLRKSYEYNLIRTLKSVEPITRLTDKKVVITSDHGKILGEYFLFSHGWWKSKYVTTVPWFELGEKDAKRSH